MITWRHDDNNQLVTDSHNDLEKIMRKGGRTRRKKNAGGYLRGPSHEQGGILASTNGEMVELEGGEYIINAQTVNAVGTEFLDELNSTQTSYHQGGYQQGQLPSPSQYRRGGRIRRNKMRRGGRPARKMAEGGIAGPGRPIIHPDEQVVVRGGRGRTVRGGRARRRMPHGGIHNGRGSCPAGQHMMPDGTCMMGSYHGALPGQYRRGGRPRTRMQAGGGVSFCPNGNYGRDAHGNTYCL